MRDLAKDNIPFNWGPEHQHTFVHMKNVLAYYNPKKQTTLQTDASIKGLSACLLQDSKPVYFVSKVLADAQKGYVVIELESLPVAWAMGKFIISYIPVIFHWKQIRNCMKPYYPKVLIKLHHDCREYLLEHLHTTLQ